MKKFIIAFTFIMIFGLNLSAYANCECSSKEIVNKLNNMDMIEKDYFVRNFLWGTTTSTKTEIVDAIEDTNAFRNALKNYINSNCSISNNKIICR